jgi:uncharacterized membrane protein
MGKGRLEAFSLIPFVTGWMGENHFTSLPTALYGLVLVMAAMAYWILQRVIIASQGHDSLLKKAVGADWKGICRQSSTCSASSPRRWRRGSRI